MLMFDDLSDREIASQSGIVETGQKDALPVPLMLDANEQMISGSYDLVAMFSHCHLEVVGRRKIDDS